MTTAIGHSDDTTDVPYLESILQAGCFLSMDRFGPGEWPGFPNWHERAQTVATLVAHGWAKRVMLGHDFPPDFIPAQATKPWAAMNRTRPQPTSIVQFIFFMVAAGTSSRTLRTVN